MKLLLTTLEKYLLHIRIANTHKSGRKKQMIIGELNDALFQKKKTAQWQFYLKVILITIMTRDISSIILFEINSILCCSFYKT